MSDLDTAIGRIESAFNAGSYPGDAVLQGSSEGDEPYEEVAPFKGVGDWRTLEPGFLDDHAGALNFFSEAGLRFFLPAFLIADLREQLDHADPLFQLTHGFSELVVNQPIGESVFVHDRGRSGFVNPQRYGAMTFFDYARYRLSIFAREEAAAIVAYLEYKRASDENGFDRERIDAALNGFWLERARTAPTVEDLERYLSEQRRYLAALGSRSGRVVDRSPSRRQRREPQPLPARQCCGLRSASSRASAG